MSETATPRSQPFHCPYCGLEELRPGDDADAWYCESCTREFELRLRRVGRQA